MHVTADAHGQEVPAINGGHTRHGIDADAGHLAAGGCHDQAELLRRRAQHSQVPIGQDVQLGHAAPRRLELDLAHKRALRHVVDGDPVFSVRLSDTQLRIYAKWARLVPGFDVHLSAVGCHRDHAAHAQQVDRIRQRCLAEHL